MKDKKQIVITCPCCHKQYLPGEIYLPKAFLGQPKLIERNNNTGEVLDADENMDLEEHFICENCLTPFRVTAKVSFYTEEEKLYNFDDDYATQLSTPQLFLSED